MAKFNGVINLSEQQIHKLATGKIVRIKREGKFIDIGVKTRMTKKLRIKQEIRNLREQLKKL